MKTIYILIINLIVGINFTTCQNIHENKRNNETNINLIFNNANCDSIIRVIENKYFTIDSGLINSLKKMEVGLNKYNQEVFETLGNHRGNNCFEVESKIKTYLLSNKYNYSKSTPEKIINLLFITDSMRFDDLTTVSNLYYYLNLKLNNNELKIIINHLLNKRHSDNSIRNYITTSKYSMSESYFLMLVENIIKESRKQDIYGYLVNYLAIYSKNQKSKEVLKDEYQWMKTDSTFLKSKIAGLIIDVELKLKSE